MWANTNGNIIIYLWPLGKHEPLLKEYMMMFSCWLLWSHLSSHFKLVRVAAAAASCHSWRTESHWSSARERTALCKSGRLLSAPLPLRCLTVRRWGKMGQIYSKCPVVSKHFSNALGHAVSLCLCMLGRIEALWRGWYIILFMNQHWKICKHTRTLDIWHWKTLFLRTIKGVCF